MKKISYNTDYSYLKMNVGYGVAGYHIIESLKKLGYEVPFSDPTAPVELFFCQPEYWAFSKQSQYKIGYWPWESTEFPESWYWQVDDADELWTTSEWCKSQFQQQLGRKVKVFRHGIDHKWTAKKRNPHSVIRFLHVGEPAPRKAGQMVVDAFIDAFGDSKDVHLTLKAHNFNTTRLYDGRGSILGLPSARPNIDIITDDISEEQMIGLYHSHDVLVYPSYGEGFGLIPLQALATGMPTICTTEWAPYANYLGDLGISGKFVESPWPKMHPGLVIEPDYDELVETLLSVKNNIDDYTLDFYNQADAVHEEYDWVRLTEEAFKHLEEKFISPP